MTRLLTLLSFLVSTIALSQEKSTYQCHFETGHSTLSKTETDSLHAWFKTIPPNAVITVEGHTDKIGSDEANELLSKNRAEQVKSLLKAFGANSDSIEVKAFGESKPLVTNISHGDYHNRRVTITATYPADTSTIWQLFQLLDEGYQTFEINPAKDTLIKGEQGTFIKIPANAFRLPSGCRSSNVTLRLKEVYKTSDMLMANLSTTSNGEILETRGMTYLDALCGTTPLKLAPKKKITHVMPIEDPVADMKFFKGIFPDSNSTINWIEEKKADFGSLPSDLMIQCLINNSSAPCRFFFCKIKRFFNSNANSSRIGGRGGEGSQCDYLTILLQQMGLDYKEGLQILYEQYNVTDEYALLEAIKKEKLKKTENAIESGEASTDQITNYVFQQATLGWANCDFYSKFPRQSLITMRTNIPISPQNRSFLVFKDINTILPPDIKGGKMENQHFLSIPKNERVILVAFKYSNGQPYIATKDCQTSHNVGELDFRPVSIEELKTEIKKLNRA